MPHLHLVADVINHYAELIQNSPVRSINLNNIWNRLCLQRLVSVVKVYCWARTGVWRWWKRWIAQKVFTKFYLANH